VKSKLITLLLLAALVFGAGAQAKEIRVLVANHPYGDLLKAAIPEYEKASGVKVNVESLQESQLTTKLTTEFATNSSSADVFMTRPLQEGKMFCKNGWYEPLTSYDFSDYPESAMGVARFYGKMLALYGPTGVTSMSWENIMPLFQAGKVAMWTDASVFFSQIVDPAKSQVTAADVGIANLPAGPKASNPFFVVSWGMAVARQSKNKAQALDFIKWATSADLAKKALGNASIPMSRNSAWADPAVVAKANPELVTSQAFAAKNGNPFDRPYMSAVGNARDLIGEVIIESINTGGTSQKLADLAKQKVKQVNELLEDTGEYGMY
jgi:ABC-type glycerol-3-phosphate transport system substrate-binding protein